ncbi:hypothetical protein [Halobaculum sp. EA56]|uniref:hypothetical protein n=1 Tax=Halobaculum sp. EA56 TaxID=3421648 RepID=UPI003EC07EA8
MFDLDRSKLLAPIFAVMLVMSLMAGGVGVQPASASHDCSPLDAMVGFATFWQVNFDKCGSHTDSSVQEVREASTNQTKVDIYNAGTSQKAAIQTHLTVTDNYLNDTSAAAWMRAEAAIAEAYKNGSSKAVAKNKARQAIANYYAIKQLNLIEQWNNSVVAYEILDRRARNESNISDGYLYVAFTYDGNDGIGPEYLNKTEGTITLVNGTSVGAKEFKFAGTWYQSSQNVTLGINDGQKTYYNPDSGSSDSWTIQNLNISAPDSNYEDLRYTQLAKFKTQWNRIQEQNDNLQTEVDPFVNNTWDAYQAGTINATDVLSSVTQMSKYGADYSTDSGNLYNTVAALSALGLDTPELNGTGTMTVMVDNVEYHGLVMARQAPNGTWEANTTYNASTIDGPVFLVTTDGQKLDLDGEFRIASISSTDGTTIKNVTTTKVVYKTSNTSELLDKMERIEELRKDMESKEQAAAGDGSGGSPIDPKYLLGALAIVGLLAYAQGNKRGE